MRIAVFGATGHTGRHVVARARSAGHDVSVLVRDPSRLPADHHARVIQGSATDPSAVEETLIGADAVISCLGVGGKGDGRPSTLVSDATRIITERMDAAGLDRIVAMSNIGAGGSGTWFLRNVVYRFFVRWIGPIIDDKERMEAVLRDSGLAWTSVRFPDIVDTEPRPVRVSASGRRQLFWISATSAADFLLDLATSDTHVGETPSVSR